MSATDVHNQPAIPHPQDAVAMPGRAIVCVVALLSAAWIAAGSIGLLADPLRCVLCWIVLGVAILADFSGNDRTPRQWIALAAALVTGLIMTGSLIAAVHVAAVAVVGFALVRSPSDSRSREPHDRAVLIAAGAVAMLAVFRLASTSIPTVRVAADAVGRFLGELAGEMAGRPLSVGASFGGVDFLVLMAAIYGGWVVCTLGDRRGGKPGGSLAIFAGGAILVGHFVYLVVLAHCGAIVAALPEPVVRETSDVDYVGVWAWGNSVRAMLPWNLPVLAAVIHAAIAAAMFRWAVWPPPNASAAESLEETSHRRPFSAPDAMWWIAPVVLAVVIPALIALGLTASKLKQNGGGHAVQRTIVAYEHGYANWRRPEYPDRQPPAGPVKPGAGDYGLLPQFVAALGGDFRIEGDLTRLDRAKVDVLLLIHPDQPWPKEQTNWIVDYVRGGGAVLVAAEARRLEHAADTADSTAKPASQSTFNELLDSLGTTMRVRNDTAVAAADHWEYCVEQPTHPIAAGIDRRRNRFAMARGCSIEIGPAARPLLVGRWAWSDPGSRVDETASRWGGGSTTTPTWAEYDPGEPLGDLVLAAEQPIGDGRVVVLGNTGALRNDGLPVAYPLVGRLLGYLANKAPSPFSWWRQLLALTAVVTLVGLSIYRFDPWRAAAAAIALSVSLVACAVATHSAGRVIPDGTRHKPNNLAYIDASHLEAYSNDTWDHRGVGGLTRNLARNGYLPLLLPELSADRLEHAGLLISIGPARPFSKAEVETVNDFVNRGGSLICMVGAEESRGSAALLDRFQFTVSPMPLPPEIDEPEPTLLARQPSPDQWPTSFSIAAGDSQVLLQAYAPWEVKCDTHDWTVIAWHTERSQQRHYVVTRPVGEGYVAVIGDTLFATNGNLETQRAKATGNIRFWRWFLPRVTGLPEWIPPGDDAKPDGEPPAGATVQPPLQPDDKPPGEAATQPPSQPDKDPGTEITPPDDLPPRITPDDVPGTGLELMPFDPLPPRAVPNDDAEKDAEEETP
ncbi:MAG: hypothetical protein HQ567_29970 [Candidatus Nealsonbacteria bacterium]|nr:hypothetical protein [Candidatus Nealsonbacteria bacterium]